MKIGICIYHTKPPGTTIEDLEYALYHCYRPLLTYLYTREKIKIGLHFSGTIYEWLENSYPEINMLISDLIKRDQVELLSGGYYDPPFCFIPAKDRGTQIEKLNTYIRKRFGKKPSGALIAEQNWQSNMVTTFNSGDISYVISFDPDESSKEKRNDRWYEPYTMLDSGKQIDIIPASLQASSMIPESTPDDAAAKITDLMKATESETVTLLISADRLISSFLLADIGSMIDYLDRFFSLLEQHDFSLRLPGTLCTRGMKRLDFLKSGWYHPDRIDISSADFHEVLKLYPESFYAYCRMYYLQRLIAGVKGDKSRKKFADQEVLKGESSRFFWPGVCGGIYRNVLRKKQHAHFIEAEKTTRERGVFVTSLNNYDFDYDGNEEYIYRGKNISAMIDRKGASVGSLDYLVTSWNYQDTFTGNPRDDCLIKITGYPNGMRQHSFQDLFFLYPTSSIEEKYSLYTCCNLEKKLYDLAYYNKESKEAGFSCETAFELKLHSYQFHIEKNYRFKSNSVEVEYTITNLLHQRVSVYFCSEINLSFPCDGADFLDISSIDASKVVPMGNSPSLSDVRYLSLYDITNNTQVGIYTKQRFSVMNSSCYTTINTPYGEEEIYQHSLVRPFWKLDLPSLGSWKNTLGLRIEKRNTYRRKTV